MSVDSRTTPLNRSPLLLAVAPSSQSRLNLIPHAYTWFVLPVILSSGALLLLLLQGTRFGKLVHERIADRPRRRLFVAGVSFSLPRRSACRGLLGVTHQIPPFHFIMMAGRHTHHLVFGILTLLLLGYGWLCDIGTGTGSTSLLASRLMSVLYGVRVALTIDEFAMLNLRDVCRAREGRASMDTVILFGALLAIGAWGAPLLSARPESSRSNRKHRNPTEI